MGRKKRDKKVAVFRLYPETHTALFNLMKELELKEVEEALELLIASFRTVLISAYQFYGIRIFKNPKTDKQFSNNCLSDIVFDKQIYDIRIYENSKTDKRLSEIWSSVVRHYREVTGRGKLPFVLELLSQASEVVAETPERHENCNNNKEEKEKVEIEDREDRNSIRSFDRRSKLPGLTSLKEDRSQTSPSICSFPEEVEEFELRVEEHRKRLACLLQKKGLKWKVERLVEVVKEWEREWGRWDERWDGYLVDILRYVHERRVVSRIRKITFPEGTEPNFPYLVVPVLKRIAKAQAEGKEKVETVFGDITLKKKKKKTGLSAKDVIKLWNEFAEKEPLLSKTEPTPFLVANIESYLELHPDVEWWEKLFRAVPEAIRRTRSPSEPRDLNWLFREGRSGKILDWVLKVEAEGKEQKPSVFLVYKDDLKRLCDECGIEKRELVSLMKEKGLRFVDRGKELTVGVTGEGADRFSALLREKKFKEALEFLRR